MLSLLLAAPLAAQIPSREMLLQGIERAHTLSASDLDTRIAHLPRSDRNHRLFLGFARLQNSIVAGNTAAIAPDLQRITSAATAIGDETTLRLVYSELADTMARAANSGSSSVQQRGEAQRSEPDAINTLHQEQLRSALNAQHDKDQQIASLRAQAQLIATEKMRQQLVLEEHNQQFQLDAITRRSHLQSAINTLLMVCLLLAVALVWSFWRISVTHKNQALEDPLTGLKNRRFLIPFMQQETQRLRRARLSALILILDIDHFKLVNDRWGHEAGDEALKQLTLVLRNCVRNADVVTRWGGEEFVIICPQTSAEHVEVICSRIRNQLLYHPMVSGEASFYLTVSIGAALFSPAAGDELWDASLARADQALYFVKQNGRNNWSLAAAPASQSSQPEAAPAS
jgi:diguanylate cyclase (GGDEF)-like protein